MKKVTSVLVNPLSTGRVKCQLVHSVGKFNKQVPNMRLVLGAVKLSMGFSFSKGLNHTSFKIPCKLLGSLRAKFMHLLWLDKYLFTHSVIYSTTIC